MCGPCGGAAPCRRRPDVGAAQLPPGLAAPRERRSRCPVGAYALVVAGVRSWRKSPAARRGRVGWAAAAAAAAAGVAAAAAAGKDVAGVDEAPPNAAGESAPVAAG